MKKRTLAGIVLLVLSVGMLAGCGRGEVDYSMEEGDTQESGQNDINSLAQFKDEGNWSDELAVVDKNNTKQKLVIEAKAVVPDADSMSVVEVERTVMDTAFREAFLSAFFEESEIYYHDEAHYTAEELAGYIAELEGMVEEFGGDMHDDMKESIEESLENYRALLSDASGSYTPAEEYESCEEYVGYREDILYRVHFGGAEVTVEPLNGVSFYGPGTLEHYEFVEMMQQYSAKTEETAENECMYSMEEAKNLAENFMKKFGRDSQVCIEEKPVMWHGRTLDANKNVTEEKYVLYGYTFTYGTGIDDIAFSMFPDLWNYDVTWTDEVLDAKRDMEAGIASDIVGEKDDAMMKLLDMFNGDRVEITVTDEGIVSLSIQAPVTIIDITGAVRLLPLNAIKDIMKNELAENGDKYDFKWDKRFNNLELMYLKTKDETAENVYSYVPTWCLSKKDEMGQHYHPVFVNAIDGSVLYIMEAGEGIE